MDHSVSVPKPPPRRVKFDKMPTRKRKPETRKTVPFVVKPYPSDITKGKIEMDGCFKFYKPSDFFDWVKTVWSDPTNRLQLYVYRNRPVCDFKQSIEETEEFPEFGRNISKWEEWPFGQSDYHMGMLDCFGSGMYLILAKDKTVARVIAKVEDYEINNYANYPPKIRIDDVITGSLENRPFLAWARSAGCVFPGEKGYEPGKYVHIETQRHKGVGEDGMTNNPISQKINEKMGEMAAEAIEEKFRPRVDAPPPNDPVLNAAVEQLKSITTFGLERAKSGDNNQLELTKMFLEREKSMTNAGGSNLELIKIMMESQQKSSDRHIEILEKQLDSIQHQLNRAPTAAQDPQDVALAHIRKTNELFAELGYTKRGDRSAPAAEPPQRDLVGMLVEAIPTLVPILVGGFQTYIQAQMRIAELQAMRSVATQQQQQFQPQQPQPQHAPQPQQPIPQQPQPPEAATPATPNDFYATANMAVRAEMGQDFESYVGNFHPELRKIDKVIIAKWMAAMHTIEKEHASTIPEQVDICTEFGAELADWYLEQKGNAHGVLKEYEPILITVIKTYKPIWDMMGKVPSSALHAAFIDGFCHPEQFEGLAPEGEAGEGNAIDPEVIN